MINKMFGVACATGGVAGGTSTIGGAGGAESDPPPGGAESDPPPPHAERSNSAMALQVMFFIVILAELRVTVLPQMR